MVADPAQVALLRAGDPVREDQRGDQPPGGGQEVPQGRDQGHPHPEGRTLTFPATITCPFHVPSCALLIPWLFVWREREKEGERERGRKRKRERGRKRERERGRGRERERGEREREREKTSEVTSPLVEAKRFLKGGTRAILIQKVGP